MKDYNAKTTKQAEELQKAIATKYPQKECRDCFYSSRGAYVSSSTVDLYYANTGDFARSRTDYDLNITTSIKNTCNYPITFVGIQQLFDQQNGYYLKEVTRTMPAGYIYSSDQGAFTSVFTTLIGGGSEFNFAVQERYVVKYASVGSVQWLKVIKM